MKLSAFTIIAFSILPAVAGSSLRMDRDFAPSAETKASPLFGKKIAVLGDSYVQNHRRPIEESWHCRIAQNYQMHYYNFGRNGNRLIFPHPKHGTVMAKRYTEIPADTDYLVIIAGHNDACAIARLNGDTTIANPTEEQKAEQAKMLATFRTGVRQFLADLKARYPKAKIAFITPWAVDRPFFPEVIATLKTETASAGIACYDAATLSGINPNDADFRKKYFQGTNDTAHLNAAGHARVQPKFEAFLNSL